MAVSIPGHLHVGVPEPARDLLNVYPLVDEQGSVSVPEVVNPNVRKPGGAGESLVAVLDGCVPEGSFAASHAVVLAEQPGGFLLAEPVLVQNLHQRGRNLEITVAGLVLRWTLNVAAL